METMSPLQNTDAPDGDKAIRLRVQHGYTWSAIAPQAGYASPTAMRRVWKKAIGQLNHKQRRNREALLRRDVDKWSLRKITRELGYDSEEQARNAIKSLRCNLRKKGQYATV